MHFKEIQGMKIYINGHRMGLKTTWETLNAHEELNGTAC